MTLKNDAFMRTRLLLGEEKFKRLQNASVTVVGLGAVGGFAAEALMRAGVGTLTLADFDTVSVSNLNRQIYALHSTIGQSKADLAQQRAREINPLCKTRVFKTPVQSDCFDELFSPRPDFVIDAIDSLSAKTNMIAYLLEHEIPFIASMGAAMRTDASRIKIGTPDKVTHCPLTAAVRQRLRRRGVTLDFPCVYSDEPRDNLPAPVYENETDMRTVMGSLPSITGIFGLTAANFVLTKLVQSD